MVSFSKLCQYYLIGTPSPSGQSRHLRLPLVLPILFLLHEVSLSPLRVTLTHFTFSSYELALRLSTSFSILGLTRLGVKPRLCISFWRVFASTHPLMSPLICSREALLAFLPSPPWNLSSFTVKSIFSSPCFCFDPSFSCLSAALAHLDFLPSHDLVLWTDGSVPFVKSGSGVLTNCFLCGTDATLSYSASPVFQVFPLKPAPFRKLFAGTGSNNKSATSLFVYSCLTLDWFSPPCLLPRLSFYFNLFPLLLELLRGQQQIKLHKI